MNDHTPAAQPGAHLTNMALALKAALDVQAAHHLSSRIALLYGPSGLGKTWAASYVHAQLESVYLRAASIWTTRTLLENLALEIGILKPERTGPKMLGQIIEELRFNPRLIILDEADFLVKRQLIEIIRDVLDNTTVGVMMIGEEALPAKLKEWERVDNRILVRAAVQPATEQDTLRLRDYYVPDGEVSDDLALHFREVCGGVTRRIVVNLEAARRAAIEEFGDGEVIDLQRWGSRSIENGAVPTRRAAVR